jgi:CheY-like chemotaxis protein/HPt (histidine-containing phosphotransfer) domain-containing protein
LLRAVAIAASRQATGSDLEPVAAPSEAATRVAPTIAQARAEGRLILVAEDDPVNQKVVLRQLALLGFAAEVAGNGAEALRLWERGGHALLVTDLHMPELDGYGLARAIREAEGQQPELARLPILALTANALRDEASRVRLAGMDEYLTKPIQLRALYAALDRWLPHATHPAAPPAAPDVRAATSVAQPAALAVDVSVLQSLVGDDPATLREFLAEFLDAARTQSAEIIAACEAGDSVRVGTVAHKLKASSRSVGALALGDLCADLENASRASGKTGIEQRRKHFESAIREVETCIVELLAEPVA